VPSSYTNKNLGGFNGCNGALQIYWKFSPSTSQTRDQAPDNGFCQESILGHLVMFTCNTFVENEDTTKEESHINGSREGSPERVSEKLLYVSKFEQ
jgi:hypothetical protein